jgi:isopentenyl phosphate kinase
MRVLLLEQLISLINLLSKKLLGYFAMFFIIKLGGSCITLKTENKHEMNIGNLTKISSQIQRAKSKNPNIALILVLGVGPFGHSNVTKYNINNGVNAESEKYVHLTNSACDFVAETVLNSLNSFGLKSMYIPAYTVAQTTCKTLTFFDSSIFQKCVCDGIIAVTTGCMVRETNHDLLWSVLSGDTIIAKLSLLMRPDKTAIGTDVDGIFSRNPKIYPNESNLIPILTSETFDHFEICKSFGTVDVTGGMKGKIQKLVCTLGAEKTEVVIFNLNRLDYLKRILNNEELEYSSVFQTL